MRRLNEAVCTANTRKAVTCRRECGGKKTSLLCSSNSSPAPSQPHEFTLFCAAHSSDRTPLIQTLVRFVNAVSGRSNDGRISAHTPKSKARKRVSKAILWTHARRVAASLSTINFKAVSAVRDVSSARGAASRTRSPRCSRLGAHVMRLDTS